MSEPIKVLIVDDHALLRREVKELLEIYEEVQVVGEAGDGKEAITKVDELTPDIILMDIRMPQMDGIEATKLIKEKHPELNILVFSMYEDAEHVLKAINAGASGYIQKDVPIDKLVNAIKQVHEENNKGKRSAVSF